MFVRRLLVIAALALGSASIVACSTASATPGAPAVTRPSSPTNAVALPTTVPTVRASNTPTDVPATDTPTSSVNPTPAVTATASSTTLDPTPGGAPPGSVATAEPSGSIRVTQADNGRTLTLRVGQTFLLALGNNLDWNVTVADPTVVSRVVNVTVVRGAQGIYRANQAGQTTLTATGRPICAPNQACPMFIQLVKVNLAVH